MRRRSVPPLATGAAQCIRAVGTVLRCLPADVRTRVVDRLAPAQVLAVTAFGGLPCDESVALALRPPVEDDQRRHLLCQVLASDRRMGGDDLRRLAGRDDFLTRAVLVAHPRLPASLVPPLIRGAASDPAGLARTVDTHSPGRVRLLLGADDPAVVFQAMIGVRLPAPLHDSAFLGAALRLWTELGTDGLRDQVDRYLATGMPVRTRSKGLRQLRPFLDIPHGRAHLERLHRSAARDGETARRLRRASHRFPGRDVLAGAVPIDWDALMRADREEPFPGQARSALLAHPDCPREFVPRLLRGVPAAWTLMAALDAGTTTAAEVVRSAAPAWRLLDFIDATTEAIGPEPPGPGDGRPEDPGPDPTTHGTRPPLHDQPDRAGPTPQLLSTLPFAYALLDLDPAAALGDDPGAWLRLLRAGPHFAGTVPELLAYAGRPGPVPPPRPPFPGDHARDAARGAASLLLTLAPAHVATQVAARLAPQERAVRRSWPRTAAAHNGPPARRHRPLTRATCLRLLTDEALDLAAAARPGSRWIWAALGLRLIGADDLLRHAHPAAAALEVLDRSREFDPAIRHGAEARLRAMAADVPDGDAVDVWLAAVTLLADDFPGTVTELTTTSRAAAVRN
ncbi:hypothetical protein [Yinghuangia sp. YIM S09857]|uniref:hypothetical protein n=1 Tax=Yinghuangia sp. YIM S09857 TaxID=3436929 RepID=UPI003F5389BE